MRTRITIPVKLCLLFSILLSLFAFVRKGDEPVDKLVAVLQRWTDSVPQEKVYLHMDKPYYALGDTIWFKGYLTIGSRHQLSALSGAVYVDLITDQDSLVRSLKLPVTSGMVMGDFILGDDLREGSYRIRAYTQWMRNAGPEYFFDHTFTVGDLLSHNIITKADYAYHDEAGKSVLTAMLNYTDDNGKPLAGRDVRYSIMIGKKEVWAQNVKTDAAGNVPVKIANDKHADLTGSYIHTRITEADKSPVTKDFPIKAGLSQTDVQFFPESGSLINGIASKVAFKAVGIDGLGTAIKGKITDEANNEVASMETLHAGMGSFMLKPQSGKSYTAHISFADNSTRDVALPKAADEGYVLSVYQPNKDSVLVRIHASAGKLNTTLSLIAHSNGETVFASPVKISSALTSVWLEKKTFPGGIAQFTIFDGNNEPLNERIAFIRGNDKMALSIKTAKATYGSKEHVLMNLEAMDSKGRPTFGNFSVAVTDESKVPVDEAAESTIFSNLLLTSDLKGYVEKPNYYFIKEDDEETDKALDNLMLTQGYRRFEWRILNNTTSTKPAFTVEGLGTAITGKVTTLGDKLLPNATVNLLSIKAGVAKATSTDANGRFKFDGMFMTDSIKFTVQARNAKNSDKVKIILDSIPNLALNKNPNLGDVNNNVAATLKTYLDNGKKEDDINEKLGRLDQVHRLREVKIRAQKIATPTYAAQGIFKIPEGSADHTYVIKDPEHCATLGICLQGYLPKITFKAYDFTENAVLYHYNNYPFCRQSVGGQNVGFTDNFPMQPMKLIIDGNLVRTRQEVGDFFDNNTIEPEDIVKVDVVIDNQAMISQLGGAAILIYTKRGMVRKTYNPSIVNITPKGFNKVREFYSPRYDRLGTADKLPDLRTTVYWDPYLKTDASGKTTFNFFNADGPGTYRVVVEGINAAGELGRQVFRYTVDGSQVAASVNVAVAMPVMAAADKSLSLITAPLDSLNKRLPVEKVYLHMDKPYYNIGDTLWFKSYLVDRVNLTASRLSGLLYVELDNDSSEMVRRVSIPIKDGLGWGQIPLTSNIFREGGYTLRAYTNWMQNFGEDYVFSQRFYLGVPASDAWLVKSNATINQVADKNQLQIDLKLNHADKFSSPVAVKKVEVKIYDQSHYLYKEELQTGIDGSLKFGHELKDKADGRRIRVQITSLDKADNNKVIQVPLTINRDKNIDLQFLPEGGNLVAGLKSTIGFKAIGEDGRGTPVAGGIYDGKGNEVVAFAAIHNGMGSFEFNPKAGEVYTARISQPVTKSFELPKIATAGTVMHIDNPEQGDQLKISLAGLNALSTDSACYLVGTARGMVYYSKKVELNQPEQGIDKKQFPSGIARFTFFKGKRPLNERAVFIDNHDQLSIKVTPNKAIYVKRDSVGLEIEVKDKSGIPVQGNFSLAVTDDSQVRPDSLGNNSIATSLLLNSDLKGHIESPGYYINRTDKQAWQALDNLMLTQGWTGYDWKDVFGKPQAIAFKAEKEFRITGKVTNLLNKPVTNAPVLISSQKPSFITTTNTDGNGIYTFKNLPQIDSGSFFLQASNSKGKKLSFGNVSVEKFKAPPIPETLKHPVLPWYVNTDSTQLNYVIKKAEIENEANIKLTGRVLKEVKIRDHKIIPNSRNRNGPGNADLVFDEQDIKKSAVLNLYELLQQKLPGFKVIYDRGFPTVKVNNDLLVIHIDGGGLPIELDPPFTVDDLVSELSKFQIAQFTGMEVMYSEKNTFRYLQPRHEWMLKTFTAKQIADAEYTLSRGGSLDPNNGIMDNWGNVDEGYLYKAGYKPGYLEARVNLLTNHPPDVAVVDITTRKGNGWYLNRAPNVVTYRPLPVMFPQQFYSPKYNVKSNVVVPDYRATLYWQANISTDQNGRAKVSFYTSDVKDKYTIKIAGADVNGGIGDGTFKLNQPATIN